MARESGQFGEAEYRAAAAERLTESYLLLRAERFAGSIYLAGRAVEAMLRAVIWKYDLEIQRGKKSLDTGHDLRQLLSAVRKLGVLGRGGLDHPFEARVQQVARLWFNNMRFASSRFVEARWRTTGEIHKRRTIKQAADEFFKTSSVIFKRCEAICQNGSSKKS
jgi:hypothetical protein